MRSKKAQKQNIAQMLQKEVELIDTNSDDSDDDSDDDISLDEFERMLEKQRSKSKSNNTQKWTDLKINKIYKIKEFKTVNTSNGESMILTLKDNGEVWCPKYLATKIKDKQLPLYVRPLGLKPCKNNKRNNYHAFDLVFPLNYK